MSADWVPFHRRLVQGPKKGLPRATRFILMELSLASRHTQGVLEFPASWTIEKAVCDLLGGDRREIVKALTLLQIQDSDGHAAIKISRDDATLMLEITKWQTYAGPKTGAERQSLYIRNKRLRDIQRHHGDVGVTSTVEDITEQERREEAVTSAASAHWPDHIPEPDPEPSVPPAPTTPALAPRHPDPEVQKLVDAIEREPILLAIAPPDRRRLAEGAMPVGLRRPLAWLLQAVQDASGDTPAGEVAHLTQKRLRSYLKAARAPRMAIPTSSTSPIYKDLEFEPGELDAFRSKPRGGKEVA